MTKNKIGYFTGFMLLLFFLLSFSGIGIKYPKAEDDEITYVTYGGGCQNTCRQGKKKELKKGDILLFGEYEQDGKKKNGKEKIEWLVLDVEKSKVLVISKDILTAREYHKESKEGGYIFWKDSSIRKWLNDSFIKSAFSKHEQKRILKSPIINEDTQEGKPGGEDTEDKIFLLSEKEARAYFQFDKDRVARLNKSSLKSAKKLSAENEYFTEEEFEQYIVKEAKNRWFWWLRGSGYGVFDAVCVDDTGKIDDSGFLSGYKHGGVRPAMWILYPGS